jgi:hypothetical protein
MSWMTIPMMTSAREAFLSATIQYLRKVEYHGVLTCELLNTTVARV